MIPKIIHYCWFGNGEKPELLKHCIESWKKFCPDYEIKEWNESNFDVDMFPYTSQAYKANKYAFVSDVARLWIVYNFGGIYLDTDVELKNNLDDLLKYDGWFASDSIKFVATGLGFGGIKGNKIIKAMLEDYENREFSLAPCPNINTESLKKVINFEYADKTRVIDNNLFIGFNCEYGKYAKHYYTATWKDNNDQRLDVNRSNEKSTFWKRLKWKIVCKAQSPKMMKYCDTHNNLFSKLYMFYAYDFVLYGFKSISNAIKNKINK